MANPSIKGASIEGLIQDLAKLRDSGRLSPALLEERLPPEDRELLDQPVNLAGWYDIDSYRRMAELICEVEGRTEELLRERGAAAARRLFDAGLYQQMESVTRMHEFRRLDGDQGFKAYGRHLKLIATLSGSILNFATFEVLIDPDHPDRYCIEVRDCESVPDVLAYTTEGFINAMAETGGASSTGRAALWFLEKGPGYLRYRMDRPV